jgi:hypothetical protein
VRAKGTPPPGTVKSVIKSFLRPLAPILTGLAPPPAQ